MGADRVEIYANGRLGIILAEDPLVCRNDLMICPNVNAFIRKYIDRALQYAAHGMDFHLSDRKCAACHSFDILDRKSVV